MRKAVLFIPIGLLAMMNWSPAFAQGDYGYREFGRETMERVRADLDRAEADVRYLSEGELRNFRHIREALADFHREWERGHYDRRALDATIGELDHLVQYARLRSRDRDFLAGDLRRLRDMRGRIDRWHERR